MEVKVKSEKIEKAIAQLESVIISGKRKELATLQRKALGVIGSVKLVPFKYLV